MSQGEKSQGEMSQGEMSLREKCRTIYFQAPLPSLTYFWLLVEVVKFPHRLMTDDIEID